MAARALKPRKAPSGEGTIRQLPSGRWQLQVMVGGKLRSYGTFDLHPDALTAQTRWRQVRLLPQEDPELVGLDKAQRGLTPAVEAAVAAEGHTCNQLFIEWQNEKASRSPVVVAGDHVKKSVVRKTRGRGGATSSRKRQESLWKVWWSPVIGPLPPLAVTEKLLDGIREKVEETQAPLTVETHISCIKAFLNWLVKTDRLIANPIADWVVDVDPVADRKRPIPVPDFVFIEILAEVLESGDYHKPKGNSSSPYYGVSRQRIRGGRLGKWTAYVGRRFSGVFDTAEEASDRVREEMSKLGPANRLIFELLVGTGGRRSEVAGFYQEDYDSAAKRIWVREPVVLVNGTNYRKPEPKSSKYRAVVVGPQLARLITIEQERRGFPGPREPLVASEEGRVINFENWKSRELRPAIEVALERWVPYEVERLQTAEGLSRTQAERRVKAEANKLRHLSHHHLRHTAAALMWAAGATDFEVQYTLGHSKLKTSRDLYGHVLKNAAETTAARVEEMRAALGRSFTPTIPVDEAIKVGLEEVTTTA